jgi:putative lipase involved disintegration of autophagic bodies
LPPARHRTPGDDRASRTHALDLLQDPALDTLLTGISHFNESSGVMQRLASGDLAALCHVVAYDEEGLGCSG